MHWKIPMERQGAVITTELVFIMRQGPGFETIGDRRKVGREIYSKSVALNLLKLGQNIYGFVTCSSSVAESWLSW